LVLTAVGPDRKGLIKDIAGHVRKLGGNIEDTRMSKLGGEFAVLVLVTGEENALSAIKESLPQVESGWGVTCFVKDTAAESSDDDGLVYIFKVSGVDHSGIVESMMDVLSSRGVNVRSLASWLEHAPLTGTPLFLLEAKVQLPQDIDLGGLETALGDACERENLEFSLTSLPASAS
jgi:glycine cleavage system transcriptional repressor